MPMLTVDDIAARLGASQRSAHRLVAAWAERAGDPRVPRVLLARTGKRGRPRHVVDRASFERWLCPSDAALAA